MPLREDSVPETGFYGTEYACRAKNSLLWYATHLQCAKPPRSEVSRHKKRMTSKSIKTF